MVLELRLRPGVDYVVEVSTNLMEWIPVMTNRTETGALMFMEDQATSASGRFFRTSEQ